MVKLIKVDGCWNCPYYRRYEGRENVYHTCYENNRTTRGNFELLFRYCELEEI